MVEAAENLLKELKHFHDYFDLELGRMRRDPSDWRVGANPRNKQAGFHAYADMIQKAAHAIERDWDELMRTYEG